MPNKIILFFTYCLCQSAILIMLSFIVERKRDKAMKGGVLVSRRRSSIMSAELKEQIAQELGFAGTLQKEGFGGVSSRNCGNMVKMAIELAERNLPKSKAYK